MWKARLHTEAFRGPQRSSLSGCTFWSELLNFGHFQERGRERQENVYPGGIVDLDALRTIRSRSVLTVKLCVQNPGFFGADVALAVAFQGPQQTLWVPPIMDRNNFAAICS